MGRGQEPYVVKARDPFRAGLLNHAKKRPLFGGFYAVASKSPHCSDATLPVFTRIPQEN